MLIDARSLPDGTQLETDVCIIGAGAAGITLVRELSDSPFRVCLLESGGFEYDTATQSLYQGENTGFPYYALHVSRLRFFGGTTNHWTGMCRPLDEIDFESRDWVPQSGWPFPASEMQPYYRRAHAICQLGPYDYEADGWETEEVRRYALNESFVRTTISQLSPPTRFGKVYRDDVEQADNCETYLYANVVELERDAAAPRVDQVRVTTLEGNKLSVRARVFVLASGAVENARLMLISDRVQAGGLGNQHDLVGRYFMEHLTVPGAIFLPSEEATRPNLYSAQERNGTRGIGHLVIAAEALRQERLLDIRAMVVPSSPEEKSLKTSEGVQSAGFLWNALTKDEAPNNFLHHLTNVVSDIDKVAIYGYERAFMPRHGLFTLAYHIEHAPNPGSRVRLAAERDRLGVRRVELAWRFGDLERRTLARANEIIGRQLGRAGLGRIRPIDNDESTGWPPGVRGAWHHMGTTRMSSDPQHGVVDANCMVHEIRNLYVAGGSVFPTCGYANPTLTIVALAVRLADHLKRVLG